MTKLRMDLIDLFDDVVDGECGKWSRICEECTKKLGLTVGVDDPTKPLPDTDVAEECDNEIICGVRGCNNNARYYINFDER